MKIKILSDSTCDLSEQLLKEHNITLAPLTVVKGDEQFKDGVTITPAEFLPTSPMAVLSAPPLPTALVNMQTFLSSMRLITTV